MSNRGIKLYNTMFADEYPVAAPSTAKPIGRNPELIEKRNDYLAHRFYFKTKMKRMMYMDAVKELSSETWLSNFHIQKVLQNNAETVLKVKTEKPTLKQLKEKWPHIIWEL
jgi:aspartyl/asparaginyl-tRNA synthetase